MMKAASLRFFVRVATGFAIVVFVTTSAFALGDDGDWPRWRGQNLNGTASETGVFDFSAGSGLKITWQKPLGSGYSSISIADGRAVTMFSDSTFDYVIAFDAESGAEQWRFKIDSTYVGHSGSHDGPLSTPVIEGNRIYALGPKGQLFALNATDGETIWSKQIIDDYQARIPTYGFSTAPIIDGDVLVVETGGDGTTISGINKNTGDLLWAAGTDTVQYQSPITLTIAGRHQLLCVGDKYLYGMDSQTGESLWSYLHKGGHSSINPVMVGENRIFINHKWGEAALIEVNKSDAGYDINEVWTSKGIKQSHNTSVLHEGYLYGYSGRFLTCVDASTGKSVWKSRPPGDGFLILVDSHLVILTKKGTLHVAPATPEKYTEVASLNLFGKTTWTPPSFANGKIYARNLYDIAAIEVAEVEKMVVDVPSSKPELVAPDSKFAQWVARVAPASDKKSMIDEFMRKNQQLPVLEGERLAHFVYRGEATDLALSGDMFNLGDEMPFFKLPGTDFYHLTVELQPDAVVNYQIVKDFEERITDPHNEHKANSFNGENSVLYMSRAADASHLGSGELTRGKIDTFRFESKLLENDRKITVYLPEGYHGGSLRYPVVYVNYGQQAFDWGGIVSTLENLAGRRFQAVLAVFVHLDAKAGFGEISRPATRDKYLDMVADELVPEIDQRYRTLSRADARLIMGGSSGAYSAILMGLRHAEVFAKVAGQSPNLNGGRRAEVIALANETEKQPVEFYLHWGKYDLRNQSELDFPADNTKFFKTLRDKGYSALGGETNDGYGYGAWRTRVDDILEAFFPVRESSK